MLADAPALADLAAVLDGQGAYAAGLLRPSPGLANFLADPPDEAGRACQEGLAEKPAAVAVGIADDDGPVTLAHDGTVALARLRPVEPRPRIWDDLLIQHENLIS